jgi:hypothetical protein
VNAFVEKINAQISREEQNAESTRRLTQAIKANPSLDVDQVIPNNLEVKEEKPVEANVREEQKMAQDNDTDSFRTDTDWNESIYNRGYSRKPDPQAQGLEESKKEQQIEVRENELFGDKKRLESPSIGILGSLEECGISMIMQ